jgi:hypothetical protein
VNTWHPEKSLQGMRRFFCILPVFKFWYNLLNDLESALQQNNRPPPPDLTLASPVFTKKNYFKKNYFKKIILKKNPKKN